MRSGVAFVTIGQSPRTDVLRSMVPLASLDGIVQVGALDDIAEHELEHLAPDAGDTPFVSRMRDGHEVLLDKKRLMPYLQHAVDKVDGAGVRTVVILCTGAFPNLSASVPLVFPDNLLRANVNELLPSGTLGIVMPNEGQRAMMQKKWERPERRTVAVSVSPYSADGAPDRAAIDALSDCDLVVLDCMGFNEEMRSSWRRSLRVPVILANRLVGRVLEEIDPDLGPRNVSVSATQSAD